MALSQSCWRVWSLEGLELGGIGRRIFPATYQDNSTYVNENTCYVRQHACGQGVSYRDLGVSSPATSTTKLMRRCLPSCSYPKGSIQSPTMKFSAAIVTILSAASVASGFVATPRQCKSCAVFTSFVSCSMHPSFDACFFVCMLAIFLYVLQANSSHFIFMCSTAYLTR